MFRILFLTLLFSISTGVNAQKLQAFPLVTLAKNCETDTEFRINRPNLRGVKMSDTGELVATFTLNENGKFTNIKLVEGSGDNNLDKTFIQSLSRWSARPLKNQGNVIACDLEVTFSIQRGRAFTDRKIQSFDTKSALYAKHNQSQNTHKQELTLIAKNTKHEPLPLWHKRVNAPFGTAQGVKLIEQNTPKKDELNNRAVYLFNASNVVKNSSAILKGMIANHTYMEGSFPYSPALGYPYINAKQKHTLKRLFEQYSSSIKPQPKSGQIKDINQFSMPTANDLIKAQLQIGYFCSPKDKFCSQACGFYPDKFNSAEFIEPSISPNLPAVFMENLGITDQLQHLERYKIYIERCLPLIEKKWSKSLPHAYTTLNKFLQLYTHHNIQKVKKNGWLGFKRYCDENQYNTSPFQGTEACEFLSAIYYGDFETAVSIDLLASLPLEKKFHPGPMPLDPYFHTNTDIQQILYTVASKALGGYIKHYSKMQPSCGDATYAYTIKVDNKIVRSDRFGRNLGTVADNSYEEITYIPHRLESYARLYMRDSGKEGLQTLGNKVFIDSISYDGRLMPGQVVTTMAKAVPKFECGSDEQKALEQQLINYVNFINKYNQAVRNISS